MKKHPSKNPTFLGSATVIFSKIDTYGAVANREEIRRNTQKHPIKNPQQKPPAKTPSKNPTGPGEDMELPKYFLKLHQTAPTGPGEDVELPKYFLKLHQTAPDLKKKIQKY